MLLRNDPPELFFAINNHGAPDTIYITTDATVNKLSFTIITNTADTKFTQGEPVPIENAPTATGSLLYLDLTELQLSDAEFQQLDCTTDNWDFKLYAPKLICFAPKADITIGPGQEIKINILKLTMSNPPLTPKADLNVNAYRVPPFALGKYPQLSFFGVAIQNPPGGNANLHDDIDVVLKNDDICNSIIPKYRPVVNSFSFSFKPGPKKNTVIAGPQTVFIVSFVYAETGPGHGALTTPKRANDEMKIDRDGNVWKVTHEKNALNPCWYLEPPAGLPIIGTGPNAVVKFDVNDIITEFKPGATIMTVQYKGIPGYNEGSYSLLLYKIPHVDIKSIAVTPNPAYLDEYDEASVYVYWDVPVKGTMTLFPGPKDVTNETGFRTKIKANTVFVLEVKDLTVNGNVASDEVRATVLAKFNRFIATPSDIYYKDFPARPQLAWNVDTPSIQLKSSITGLDPNHLDPVDIVSRDIQQPQMMTLIPNGVTEPVFMRNLVLNAFKPTIVQNKISGATWQVVLSPSGNFAFGIYWEWPSLYVINTLTLKEAIPPIFIDGLAKGIAISPDGKLLYVSSAALNSITVFEVNETADGNISVKDYSKTKGTGPHQMVTSPSGDQLYVVHFWGRSAMVVYNKTPDNNLQYLAAVNFEIALKGIAVTPSGKYIFVSTDTTGSVYVIERREDNSFPIVATISSGHGAENMVVSPNGDYLFVCNERDNSISVVSLNNFSVIERLNVGAPPLHIAINAGGDKVLVSRGIDNGGIAFIEYADLQRKYVLRDKSIPVPTAVAGGIAFLPNGNQAFIASGPSDSTVSLLTFVQYQTLTHIPGLNMQPTSALASPNKQTVLVWHNPNIVGTQTLGAVAVDTTNYTITPVLQAFGIYDVVYSSNNKLLYTVQSTGKDQPTSIHVRNADTYIGKDVVEGITGTPDKIALSSDGYMLFASLYNVNGTNNGVAIIKIPELQVLQTILLPNPKNSPGLPLAATPDMTKIFVAQNDSIAVLERGSNGYALRNQTIPVGPMTTHLGVLPDGSKLVVVSTEGHIVYVIDTSSYAVQQVVIPQQYCKFITGLAISPDGRQVAVCGLGASILLFIDMATLKMVYAIDTQEAPQCPVFLPDASRIFVPCFNTGSITVIGQVQPLS